MLDSAIVQPNRTLRDLRRVAKPALAGLLATLFIAFGLLAASDPLHRSFHERTPGASFCAVCLFAQGQIELANTAPVLAASLLFFLCGLLAASAGVPWSVVSLLPPGRAPPRPSHIS